MRLPAYVLSADWHIFAGVICFIALLATIIIGIALFCGHPMTVGSGIRFTFVKAE